MFDEQLDTREKLIKQMKMEMLGPGSEEYEGDSEYEILSGKPEKRYCVGILYPKGNKCNIEEDETMSDTDSQVENELEKEDVEEKEQVEDVRHGSGNADMEDTLDEKVSSATKLLPSSMGATFYSDKKLDILNVNVSFAMYTKASLSDCKIMVSESGKGYFEVPESLEGYFKYDREKNEVSLVRKCEKNKIWDVYNADKADDGTFKKYAYKLIDIFNEGYKRVPKNKNVSVSFLDADYYNPHECIDDTIVRISALRYDLKNGYYSYTIMISNSESGNPKSRNCIFQPVIRISSEDNNNLKFVDNDMVADISIMSEEEISNNLLYRNKKNYGSGLGVALNWKINKEGYGFIETTYFPENEVPQMNYKIDEKYRVDDRSLNMKFLSDLNDTDKNEKIECLETIISAYGKWIEELEKQEELLDQKYNLVAKQNINNCKKCYRRMIKGIEYLKSDDTVWNSFLLANRAMFMQRVHIVDVQPKDSSVYPNIDSEIYDRLQDTLEDIDYYKCSGQGKDWRSFQLAFLIMSISSIVNEKVDNEDRNLVDLIWFPTGGGKTEAYLGLTAFTIFFRKLKHLQQSDGTAIIMRYTLRLLAAQQFTRASTLICACELIRIDCAKRVNKYPKYDLGSKKITIGLWIGGEHTPNRLSEVKDCNERLQKVNVHNIISEKDKYYKFQVLKCPWCGTKIVKDLVDNKVVGEWGYSFPKGKKFYLRCTNDCCPFEKELPIQVVDEELYKNPPTLLFATVDKFAMMPWYSEIGSFFAVNNDNRTPELIIQDELHLISGPLGSIVGLYETAIDYLCSLKGVKPKIIASTATICRAKEQCSALYNREVFQFPPQGLNSEDSFFAREFEVSERFGRKYIGLMPAGKTKATMESRVLATLLQLGMKIEKDDEVKDCYWTITSYFNSLKELGKCSTYIQNDVRDNILRMARRDLFKYDRRRIIRADELTSRVSTTELNQTLDKLEKVRYTSDKENRKKYPANILLATNMISVGIDVERLNVMTMIGQPKLTSEYIQASSRVGRKYPGVVFTIYDGTRSRDRSHYEQFKSYHDSFYKYVEPTGVTPFSDEAKRRALHAVIISILRHGFKMETDEELSKFNYDELKEELKQVTEYILERINDINNRLSYEVGNEENETKNEIEDIFDKINVKVQQSHNNAEYGNIMGHKNEGKERIMKPFGTDYREPITFDTLTSMRNVDSSVNVNVVILED